MAPGWMRRFGVTALASLVALSSILQATPPSAASAQGNRVPPGGPPPGGGPIELTGFVRIVDGQSIDAVIGGNRVAIGILGVDAPQANTSCGRRATDLLKDLAKAARARGGLRLVDDPSEQYDERGRRLYYVEEKAGRPIADELVKAGVAKAKDKGKDKDKLKGLEDEARRNGRGCLWGGPSVLPGLDDADGPGASAPDAGTFMALHLDAAADQARTPAGEPAADRALAAPSAAPVAAVPTGFVDEVVVGGLNDPTALAFLPDGRILIAQKNGVVRIVKNGALLSTPFIDLSDRVNDYWDRGLLGIAAHPNFASNGYVYLAYTYENDANDYSGTKTSRITRVTASGDTASRASEVAIVGKQVGRTCYDFPAGADCIPTDWFGHAVGSLKFAPDGTLFASMGDGANWNTVNDDALRAQNLDSLAGKVLRVTPDGAGVSGNPFWNGNANANRSKVWAYGARNPFRFNLRPNTSVPYLGDVGWSTWEEIDVAPAGANLGWPCYEGGARQGGYEPRPACQTLYGQGAGAHRAPLVAWDHGSASASATGGTFYTGTAFPAEYRGAYFYGDYALGFIRYVKVDANNNLTAGPTTFGTASNPVAFEMGADGSLYYVAIFTGEIRRIRYGAPAPPPPPPPDGTQYVSDLTWISATNGWGPAEKDMSNGELPAGDGVAITLNGRTYPKGLGVHAPSDIRYNLGGRCTRFTADVGVDDESGTAGSVVFEVWADGAKLWNSPTMTGATATQAASVDLTGKQELRLVVTDAGNGNVSDHADWAAAQVTCGTGGGNTPPRPTISAPASTVTYKVGDTIAFSGSAADDQDGTLPASGLSWEVVLHHCPGGVCHVHQLFDQSGVAGGNFTAPDEADDNRIEIKLTARDSGGLTASTSVTLQPQTVQITIATNPPGLQVTYSGETGPAPLVRNAIVGSKRTIHAPSPQNGATFVSWSDGGAQQHDVTVGTTSATYTATFTGGPPPGSTFHVSDLTPTVSTNGWGPVEKDRSNGEEAAGDGRTLTLNGRTYAKGLGVHAASDVRYGLGGRCTQFVSDVGVDDEVGTLGSVVFQVWVDGAKLYDSGAMTGATATRTATVDVTNKQELRLVVTDAGNGPDADHADWADARLTCGSAPPPPPPPPAGTRYVSDLTPTSATNGWGPVERDRSNGESAAGDGRTLTLNGKTYAKGLGVHAASDVRYAIPAGCTRFQAEVGVDDEVGANGSVVFQVWGDGTRLYDSGAMTGATATKVVSVDVTGRAVLRLVVTDGGNGAAYDHADWADARLTCG